MKNFVFLYCVEYTDISGEGTKVDYGLLYADNFTDAAHCLEENIYGSDLIKIKELEPFDTTAIFTKNTYDTIRKELNTL